MGYLECLGSGADVGAGDRNVGEDRECGNDGCRGWGRWGGYRRTWDVPKYNYFTFFNSR